MILVSVDPSVDKSAVAVFANGILLKTDLVSSKPKAIKQWIEALLGGAPSSWVLAIEDQYLGVNVQSLKKLTAVKIMWQLLALQNNATGFYEVMPSRWQRQMLGVVPKGKTKEYSLARSHELGLNTLDHNISDAYLIGVYILENYQVVECKEDING